MKKLLILLNIFVIGFLPVSADNTYMKTVSDDNGNFGVQDSERNIIIKPEYKKIIRLGKSSWIVQKKNKYGLVDNCGNELIKPKYRHVERILGKYVKLGNENNFGIYDEYGDAVLPPEYSSINLLFGGMFLTCKNYKYGISDFSGNVLLENKFDDIYMPKPNIMRIKYNGAWYEIERVAKGKFSFPDDLKNIENDSDFRVSSIINSPAAVSGYSAITFTDYLLKLFSSISPAHEETIDELMFSQGADTVSIFMKFAWLPKYPFTYAKKYYYYIRVPNNGPLSTLKDNLRRRIR